jgi:hypothetical protein
MKQFKHIITSGCSFSDVSNNFSWPCHLTTSYNIECNHLGLGSQGNGLIARKAVYAVHSALKQGYKPEEILVGIMWSGHDRHDIYFQHLSNQLNNTDHWRYNPTHVVENDSGGWLIMNSHWTEKTNKIYYTHLHDHVNQRVLTFEKILWVQNYLDNLGIKYFMTDFMRDNYYDNTANGPNPNIDWLVEQVDKTKWLPVNNMHDWCCQYWSDDHFPILDVTLNDGQQIKVRDFHPQPEMHKKFVREIILPFIKTNFSDYYCPEFREYVYP